MLIRDLRSILRKGREAAICCSCERVTLGCQKLTFVSGAILRFTVDARAIVRMPVAEYAQLDDMTRDGSLQRQHQGVSIMRNTCAGHVRGRNGSRVPNLRQSALEFQNFVRSLRIPDHLIAFYEVRRRHRHAWKCGPAGNR